jgi:hypothetical protein
MKRGGRVVQAWVGFLRDGEPCEVPRFAVTLKLGENDIRRSISRLGRYRPTHAALYNYEADDVPVGVSKMLPDYEREFRSYVPAEFNWEITWHGGPL